MYMYYSLSVFCKILAINFVRDFPTCIQSLVRECDEGDRNVRQKILCVAEKEKEERLVQTDIHNCTCCPYFATRIRKRAGISTLLVSICVFIST